jgi:Predicted nucleic-acid-binding protein containing a Zn-ribbon
MPHNPLRPQPVATAETRVFWDGAGEGVLRLRRCTSCGRLAAPLAPRCAGCLGADFAVETLSGRAALKGRTVLHLPVFPGREGSLAIAECALEEDPRIVLIALDEGRVTESMAPGAPLQLTFPATAEGARFAVVQAPEARS